jgi:hypothetical protein
MKRAISSATVGEGVTRHRVRVEGDACPAGTQLSRLHAYRLLTLLAEVPDVLACGTTSFSKLTVHHDGSRWVAEAEATVNADGEVLD